MLATALFDISLALITFVITEPSVARSETLSNTTSNALVLVYEEL